MTDKEMNEQMALVIDLPRALREPEYCAEVSEELETDITSIAMEEAAREIERLRTALREIEAMPGKVGRIACAALAGAE